MTYARQRRLYGQRDWNVPSRFLDEIPAELTDREVRSPRSSMSTWDRWGTGAAPARRPEPAAAGASFVVGDDVVHASLGDGVVVGQEPGGVVVVRFASDGSERKLMADYAPITKR